MRDWSTSSRRGCPARVVAQHEADVTAAVVPGFGAGTQLEPRTQVRVGGAAGAVEGLVLAEQVEGPGGEVAGGAANLGRSARRIEGGHDHVVVLVSTAV